MTNFTVKRKADRSKMAAIVKGICDEFGATAAIENQPYGDNEPRLMRVNIQTDRGLCVSIDFDGDSTQPNVFVNAWHMNSETDACLSDRFNGSVNQSHFGKSTTVCYGFDDLCNHVRKVLDSVKDGTAFCPDRERRKIAKNGTWQETAAKWETYRVEWRKQQDAKKLAQARESVS